MRRMLLIAALSLLPRAGADAFDAGPLGGVTLCLGHPMLGISQPERALPERAQATLEDAMRVKAQAYRLLGSDAACPVTQPVRGLVLANITFTRALDGTRAYSIELSVEDYVLVPGSAVSRWNASVTTVSRRQEDDLLGAVTTTVKDLMDRLAADYALANP